jgi:hypothetical protein
MRHNRLVQFVAFYLYYGKDIGNSPIRLILIDLTMSEFVYKTRTLQYNTVFIYNPNYNQVHIAR